MRRAGSREGRLYTDTVSIVVKSVAIRVVQLRLPRRVRARKRGRVRVFLLPHVHGACLSMSAWTLFTTTSSYCGQTDFRVVNCDSAADPSPDLGTLVRCRHLGLMRRKLDPMLTNLCPR